MTLLSVLYYRWMVKNNISGGGGYKLLSECINFAYLMIDNDGYL